MQRVALEQGSKQSDNLDKNNSSNTPYCLRFSTPGQLKNLYCQELPEQFLQADEI